MAVIEAPLGFLEVEDEEFGADAAELGEAQLGEAPEAFDAVDVVLSARELVLVMMDAVVLVAAQHQAVVGLPAVGINGGFRKHLSLYNRHQCLLGAVVHDLREDLPSALEQADNGRFSTRAAPALAAHPTRPEVAFVHFDLASKRLRLLDRQLQNPQPQPVVKPLRGLRTQPRQTSRRQRRYVRAKQPQYRTEFHLRNVRVMNVSVLQ